MWIYQGEEFTDPEKYYGFIYEITNLVSGRKYIGKKFFTAASRKQKKGKVKKIRIESDWRDYWGSSEHLLKDLEELGKENFKREIIRLCLGRGETNYWETKLQFQKNVLEERFANGDFVYYNGNICMKYTRVNIGKASFLNEQSP